MAKIAPFHSDEQADTRWHNQDDCYGGHQIEPQNLRQGTGGRPYCQICARIARIGGR